MENSTKSRTDTDIRLKADGFVSIRVDDTEKGASIFYGGDQIWYPSYTGKVSACGAVAAANIFAYLAQNKPEYEGLFLYKELIIPKERFISHMVEVMRYVSPIKMPLLDLPLLGLPFLTRFTHGGIRYAASKGIRLKGHYYTHRDFTFSQAVDCIREQLSWDNPVALLNIKNNSLKRIKYIDGYGRPVQADFQFHWVTITGISETNGRIIIDVSSEGGKAVLDFYEVWENEKDSFFGKRGIVYFGN